MVSLGVTGRTGEDMAVIARVDDGGSERQQQPLPHRRHPSPSPGRVCEVVGQPSESTPVLGVAGDRVAAPTQAQDVAAVGKVRFTSEESVANVVASVKQEKPPSQTVI